MTIENHHLELKRVILQHVQIGDREVSVQFNVSNGLAAGNVLPYSSRNRFVRRPFSYLRKLALRYYRPVYIITLRRNKEASTVAVVTNEIFKVTESQTQDKIHGVLLTLIRLRSERCVLVMSNANSLPLLETPNARNRTSRRRANLSKHFIVSKFLLHIVECLNHSGLSSVKDGDRLSRWICSAKVAALRIIRTTNGERWSQCEL